MAAEFATQLSLLSQEPGPIGAELLKQGAKSALQESFATLPLSSKQASVPLQDPGATVPVVPEQASVPVQLGAAFAEAAMPHTIIPSAKDRLATNKCR
jgi:hypothetical protein